MSLAHHSLVAWQRADDLFIRLHQLSLKHFPSHERFELGSQLRRAAFSVAANIAEGFAHPPGRTRLRFLNIAHASLAEVGYCIHVALRLEQLASGTLTRYCRTEAFMHNEFTAVFERDGDWFIGYCPEIPGANGQGRTKEEARASLAAAIALILDDRREEGLRGVPADAERETVTVR